MNRSIMKGRTCKGYSIVENDGSAGLGKVSTKGK